MLTPEQAIEIYNRSKKLFSEVTNYEAKNILERFFLSYLNGNQNALNKANYEIRDKEVKLNMEEATKLFSDIDSEPTLAIMDIRLTKDKLQIITDQQEDSITFPRTHRVNFLIKLLENKSPISSYDMFQIGDSTMEDLPVEANNVIIPLLLYGAISGNGSQQWGVPTAVALYLYNNLEFRNEGFASPLNSRFIELDNTSFYSLFPEEDSQFGSSGSFFSTTPEMMLQKEGNWYINPPMIEWMIESMADKINQFLVLAHKQGIAKSVFVTLGNWSDATGYIKLMNSSFLTDMFVFKPKTFKYEDVQGNKFSPGEVELVYFYLQTRFSPILKNEDKKRIRELMN